MSADSPRRTDPKLWEQVKRRITRGSKGGRAGQWSARKAQLAVAEYKKAGGGYEEGSAKGDTSLAQWGREEWGTKSGERSRDTGERYLPKRAREGLSDAEYRRSSDKKRADTAKGKQFSRQPGDVAEKAARARGTPEGRAKARARREFREAANMGPRALERWLGTEESRSVGTRRAGVSVGRESGRQIVAIKRTQAEDLTEEQYRHMRKVVGYVKRHLAQRPDGDVSEAPWRWSLMNWGHDPLRK